MTLTVQGRLLVGSSGRNNDTKDDPNDDKDTTTTHSTAPNTVLRSHVPLSFWGGIDPTTGIVTDTQHPLHGETVTNTVLCIPVGRGSCTASQVLLELVLRQKGPHAIILRDTDPLLTVGAIVAEEVFFRNNNNNDYDDDDGMPIIVVVGREGYQAIMEYDSSADVFGSVLRKKQSPTNNEIEVIFGDTRDAVVSRMQQIREENALLDNSSQSETMVTMVPPLNGYEQSKLQQATTDAERMALRVVFRHARIQQQQQAEYTKVSHLEYTPIQQAHIDGCTYIGPGGLALAHKLAPATVKVPTTLNSMSTDRQQWQQYGVPSPYANNALALAQAYVALGCTPSFTCAPYLLLSSSSSSRQSTHRDCGHGALNIPTDYMGQHWAWGESNAVVFANSVLGARTEKTADYLDICQAIAGIVPLEGMHLDRNRRPTVVLDAGALTKAVVVGDTDKDVDSLFPVLGHLCGTLSDGHIPLVVGLEEWADWVTLDQLKAFCAAFGTTGSAPLIHVAGITPEARHHHAEWTNHHSLPFEKISMNMLRETYNALDKDTQSERIDLVALGNPHLSKEECGALAGLVTKPDGATTKSASKHSDTRIIACLSRTVFAQAESLGYIAPLKQFGMEFIHDTCWCMLLDPPVIPPAKNATILSNSGKYCHYGPGLVNRQFRFGSLADCVETARTGRYAQRSYPPWLGGAKRNYHSSMRVPTTLQRANVVALGRMAHLLRRTI